MTFPNVAFEDNNLISSHGDLCESAWICTLGQTALDWTHSYYLTDVCGKIKKKKKLQMQLEWAGNQLWATEVLSMSDSNYINYEQMWDVKNAISNNQVRPSYLKKKKIKHAHFLSSSL